MPTWTDSFSCTGLFRRGRWPWGSRRRAVAASPELSARRAAAMRRLFPKLASWLDKQTHVDAMIEANSFLSQAADLGDLERRIRDLERRRGAPRWAQ